MKYDENDFKKVKKGEATIEEMCKKYNVPRACFYRAMNRQGYYVKKAKIKIISPTKTKIVYSFSACADELKVSQQTIRNYLNGKRVKLFEKLDIKIKVEE